MVREKVDSIVEEMNRLDRQRLDFVENDDRAGQLMHSPGRAGALVKKTIKKLPRS